MVVPLQFDIIENAVDEAQSFQIIFHFSFVSDVGVHAAFIEILCDGFDEVLHQVINFSIFSQFVRLFEVDDHLEGSGDCVHGLDA